jgi:hypothetical protein
MLIINRSGLQIFLPFHQLPSRSLKDYYALIKDPVSLNAVQKKVRGVVGRNAPTGHTELKSWDAFEKMTSMIWKNAREYNEDGSDLYNVSLELEVCASNSISLCSTLTQIGNVQAAVSSGQSQS